MTEKKEAEENRQRSLEVKNINSLMMLLTIYVDPRKSGVLVINHFQDDECIRQKDWDMW